MKYVSIILGVLVLIFVCISVLIIPTLDGFSGCLKQASGDLDLLLQKRITQRWSKQQNCAEVKPINEKLLACYNDVGKKSLFQDELVFTLGGLINSSVKNQDRVNIINRHNSSCSQYPETLISN